MGSFVLYVSEDEYRVEERAMARSSRVGIGHSFTTDGSVFVEAAGKLRAMGGQGDMKSCRAVVS
jgi:hypothetical protein